MNQAEQMRKAAAKIAEGWRAALPSPVGGMSIASAIRALPIPEPTPDKRDEALAKARESAIAVEVWSHGLRHRTAHENKMVSLAHEALAAINAALPTDAPKLDTRRSEEEVRGEIARLRGISARMDSLPSSASYARIAALEWTLSGEKNEKETGR